mmetsp:Transcript_5861/g.17447  ORF Transcript_5861/g.17447 Transcript_5861/m.17447 type:complete len:127 (-) Transcript_5861:57-437(-)
MLLLDSNASCASSALAARLRRAAEAARGPGARRAGPVPRPERAAASAAQEPQPPAEADLAEADAEEGAAANRLTPAPAPTRPRESRRGGARLKQRVAWSAVIKCISPAATKLRASQRMALEGTTMR